MLNDPESFARSFGTGTFTLCATGTATFARCSTGFGLAAQVANHVASFAVIGVLVVSPPFAQAVGFLARAFAQQQEIVAGAEAWVLQEQVGAFAGAAWQTLLHVPDLADRQGEPLRNRNALALLDDQFVGGLLHGRDRRHATFLQAQYLGRQCRP